MSGMSASIYSTMIRDGRTTYFVDMKEAKSGKLYLSITESVISGEDRHRNTIRVMGVEAMREFAKVVKDITEEMEKQIPYRATLKATVEAMPNV